MPWAVAGAAIGAVGSIYSSSQASSAAGKASDMQQAAQDKNIARTQPFVDVGSSAASQLQGLNTAGFTQGQPNYLDMAAQNVPNANNMANLVNTPGYQFNLQQGLTATQNSAAARGLGVSGAAMKGAATYATGLADTTYQNQFNNQQTKQQDYLNLNTGQQGNAMNLYNRLSGTAALGANAASGVGTTGANAANAAGNYLGQSGAYSAAGSQGATNAVSGSIQNYLSNNALTQAIGGGQTTGYTNSADGRSYQSSSNPDANF